MRLLKLEFRGDSLFANSEMSMDFYASDRVLASGRTPAEVTRVGRLPSTYSLNVVGIGGVNASGKTTTIKLIILALSILQGRYIARGVGPELVSVPAKLEGSFRMRAAFWHEGAAYCLESELGCVRSPEGRVTGVRFDEERLWEIPRGRLTKALLADFDSLIALGELRCSRHGERALHEDLVRALGEGVSISRTVIGEEPGPRVPTGKLERETLPTPVVRVFDPSVEFLVWDDDADVYHLKFAGEEVRAVSRDAAQTMLSAGTLIGSSLVKNAIEALRDGGYLIVDEIENSLNKTLVSCVINLFASPSTNPHGALLVFTTHYPELLDVLDRKDNLYLVVRGEDGGSRVVKYSDSGIRIENKKSEAMLSNLIRGSNPSYPLVREMRDFVREAVRG